jgi:hypothetical protein
MWPVCPSSNSRQSCAAVLPANLLMLSHTPSPPPETIIESPSLSISSPTPENDRALTTTTGRRTAFQDCPPFASPSPHKRHHQPPRPTPVLIPPLVFPLILNSHTRRAPPACYHSSSSLAQRRHHTAIRCMW